MLLTLLSPQPTGGGVTGNLSATLAALTLAADGTITQPSVTADLSATLAAVTLSSDATVASAGVTANLSATLAALSLSSGATITQPAITGNLSATLGALTLSALASSGVTGGGGASARRQRGRGWAREREILEQSLRQIDEAQIQGIARAMADSERPQAQRIARKLIDYSGELRELQSLQREIGKLQAAQREAVAGVQLRAEQERELTAAAEELRLILRDEEDFLDALAAVEQWESRLVLSALGIAVH